MLTVVHDNTIVNLEQTTCLTKETDNKNRVFRLVFHTTDGIAAKLHFRTQKECDKAFSDIVSVLNSMKI